MAGPGTSGLRLAAYERPVPLPPAQADSEPTTVMRVSPELFPLLGVAPALGRAFDATDRTGQVAIVSHGFWQHRFGGAADVVGRPLRVGAEPVLVVGVMPAGFEVPNAAADLWLPLDTNLDSPARYAHTLRVVGRSVGRSDPAAVRGDLDLIAAQLADERPAENSGWRVTVQSLFETVVSPEVRRSLWLTAGAVAFAAADDDQRCRPRPGAIDGPAAGAGGSGGAGRLARQLGAAVAPRESGSGHRCRGGRFDGLVLGGIAASRDR